MASETLQTAIQYTYYLCEFYEKNGERILGNQQPLAEFAGFSYYKYLLYLANLDRRLEETEVQYLNDLLHYNMTLSQLQTFCKRHPFTAESVQDTLRGLLDLWIRADLAEQGDSSLSLFFTASHARIFTARKSDFANVSKSTISVKIGSIFTLEKSIFSCTGAAAGTEMAFSAFLSVSSGFMVGNRMTSRMVSAPVSSMTQRSMPIPMPPVGGIPYSMAVR